MTDQSSDSGRAEDCPLCSRAVIVTADDRWFGASADDFIGGVLPNLSDEQLGDLEEAISALRACAVRRES